MIVIHIPINPNNQFNRSAASNKIRQANQSYRPGTVSKNKMSNSSNFILKNLLTLNNVNHIHSRLNSFKHNISDQAKHSVKLPTPISILSNLKIKLMHMIKRKQN